jgi:hypothetical protein
VFVRRSRAAVVASCLLALASVPAAVSKGNSNVNAAAAGGDLSTGPAKRIKGRAVAHGPFVPGQTASVSVSRMPRRAPVFAFITPIQNSAQCDGAHVICPVQYVAGDPAAAGVKINPIKRTGPLKKINTSSSGHAELNFTMPSEFLGIPFGAGLKRYPYLNLQAIRIVAFAIVRKDRRTQVIGKAKTKTFIQVPQAVSGT